MTAALAWGIFGTGLVLAFYSLRTMVMTQKLYADAMHDLLEARRLQASALAQQQAALRHAKTQEAYYEATRSYYDERE